MASKFHGLIVKLSYLQNFEEVDNLHKEQFSESLERNVFFKTG